jgi:hypothetical protein
MTTLLCSSTDLQRLVPVRPGLSLRPSARQSRSSSLPLRLRARSGLLQLSLLQRGATRRSCSSASECLYLRDTRMAQKLMHHGQSSLAPGVSHEMAYELVWRQLGRLAPSASLSYVAFPSPLPFSLLIYSHFPHSRALSRSQCAPPGCAHSQVQPQLHLRARHASRCSSPQPRRLVLQVLLRARRPRRRHSLPQERSRLFPSESLWCWLGESCSFALLLRNSEASGNRHTRLRPGRER